MSDKEIQLYLDRAKKDLQAIRINIENDLYTVAISRAYFVMFYAASALLKSIDVERKKHSGIVSAFGEHFVKPGLIDAKFSRMLVRAFESRNDTDYDVYFVIDAELAQKRFQEAQAFVEKIEAYLGKGG
ncbi:MAG: HEPN domain-containing protein [Ardenticatenaceae bacterium]|nr:MAG: HEPN domain-containing protein [Ardenticatenaceae bacterium]